MARKTKKSASIAKLSMKKGGASKKMAGKTYTQFTTRSLSK